MQSASKAANFFEAKTRDRKTCDPKTACEFQEIIERLSKAMKRVEKPNKEGEKEGENQEEELQRGKEEVEYAEEEEVDLD